MSENETAEKAEKKKAKPDAGDAIAKAMSMKAGKIQDIADAIRKAKDSGQEYHHVWSDHTELSEAQFNSLWFGQYDRAAGLF